MPGRRAKTAAALGYQFVMVAIGLLWLICGDSHTEGRAPPGTCQNPGTALRHILNENEGTNITGFVNLGVGGSTLSETTGRYLAAESRANRTFVWTQESGNQQGGGDSQISPAAFRATFITHCIHVDTESPGAEQVYETPFSFGRGPAPISPPEDFRAWGGEYEDALRSAIVELREVYGIIVHLAETNADILALQAYSDDDITITPYDVWYQRGELAAPAGRGPEFHFTALGNFMVALSVMVAIGRNPLLYTYDSITDVTAAQKTACLNVIKARLGL